MDKALDLFRDFLSSCYLKWTLSFRSVYIRQERCRLHGARDKHSALIHAHDQFPEGSEEIDTEIEELSARFIGNVQS